MAVTSTPIEARAEQQNRGASFPLAGTKRFALAGARILASRLPEKTRRRPRRLCLDGRSDRSRGNCRRSRPRDAVSSATRRGRSSRAASSCRRSSTRIPISTRLTSGAARRIRPAISRARSMLSSRIARPTGPRAMSQRAWTSVCARPTPTATAAIRTHIDSIGPQTRISWPVVAEAARALARADRFAGGAAVSHRIRARRHPTWPRLEAMLDAYGSNILGAATFMIPAPQRGPRHSVRAR